MSKGKPAVDQLVKLIVGAGQAAPTPPVGPALGSKGVKSMDFCKEFNARTAHYVPGTPIPARIIVRPDRSFTFTLKTPTTSMFLLSAAGVSPIKNKFKGAGNTPGARSLAQIITSSARGLNTPPPSTDPYADTSEEPALSAGPGGNKESGGSTNAAAAPASSSAKSATGPDPDPDTETQHVIPGLEKAQAAKGRQSSSKDAKNGNAVLGTVGNPVSLKHVYEIARIKQVDNNGASLRAIASAIVAQAGSMGVVIVP